MSVHDADPVLATQRWVETFVIGQNLCPFAKREIESGRVRMVAVPAKTESALSEALACELNLLHDTAAIETTLIIHPGVLTDFLDYNQFVDIADELIRQMNLEGVFQVASFHPHYRFAEAADDDPANYTNRSPYPMLHLIREASLERAVDSHPDIDAVPERNIRHLRAMGLETLRQSLQQLYR